jgi:hypothetical protein
MSTANTACFVPSRSNLGGEIHGVSHPQAALESLKQFLKEHHELKTNQDLIMHCHKQ